MSPVHISKVPDDAEIYTGSKGGRFYFRNGIRVYINTGPQEHRSKTKFTPRRGAFLRFIENQVGL